MKTNNNYHPRPPMGEWIARLFFLLLAIAAIGGIIEKCSNL
jgi:hypothetical protein